METDLQRFSAELYALVQYQNHSSCDLKLQAQNYITRTAMSGHFDC